MDEAYYIHTYMCLSPSLVLTHQLPSMSSLDPQCVPRCPQGGEGAVAPPGCRQGLQAVPRETACGRTPGSLGGRQQQQQE